MEHDSGLIGIDVSTASPVLIELLLDEASDSALFEEIAEKNAHRPEIMRVVASHTNTPEHLRQRIKGMFPDSASPDRESSAEKWPGERTGTFLQRIQRLSVSEKIQLALKGGKEVRSILLREPNKEISLTVLENPKLTETEVESLARSRSVADEVLRKIAKKKEWLKNYQILLALVSNPKTPTTIAVPLVTELKTRDLSILSKNKNVSEGVRATAKKILRARQGH